MSALASAPRRTGTGRPLILAWLLILATLCWAWLVARALRMATPDPPFIGVAAPPAAPYGPDELGLVFTLWAVLCPALLLPAAAPAVLVFARVTRLHRGAPRPYLSTALFVLGCMAAWSAFGALGALLQWALHDAGALDSGLAIDSSTLAGLALVSAGVYQWTAAKHASLQQCREPLANILAGWRPGPAGALRMGMAHGSDCVRCTFLLLLLPLATGVANLGALAGLAGLILAEKTLPGGALLAIAGGLALLAMGTGMLFP